MNNNQEFSSFADIVKVKPVQKAPAYPWQELALNIINELQVPAFKRSSVFQACKKYPKTLIEGALNDTKELCKNGESWKYFFKVLTDKNRT